MPTPPTLEQFRDAHSRIAPHIHRTPVFTSRRLDELTGARLFFKCENLQKCGVFKVRGALNTVLGLDDDGAARGVVTHSSGNHAAALAWAASKRGIAAHIVMPSNSPKVKVAAVKAYGGKITFCEPTLAAREQTAAQVQYDTGALFIHPYDDARVITGQGTAAIEFLDDVPDLDVIMTPVGGGGLLSGSALAAGALKPGIRVWAGEPAGADDAFRSLRAGRLIPVENPETIADGLRTSLGQLTFPIIRDHVETILTAQEQTIIRAMHLVMQRMKLVVEPSAAVPLAGLLDHPEGLKGLHIGIVLSGGNVDLSKLPFGN